MLIYNILAEGSLAGAGKPVTLPAQRTPQTKNQAQESFFISWEAPVNIEDILMEAVL